ncbi:MULTISPECIES: phosphatidate cytidylyltransferase [Arthrobacter]|uniref:Phosphatidate cytidylyltransferase n=2 Tax=Arthrobacter TaxID=1663 RepID=A0ABU9KN71_9MICC|nr:phosphatidate cytidylyltransferase [Arthrobacter sp. YJM1]MDP5228225.1 phosphatidate cytidylyltransferase [Arthrobacter sp. YJM1]
MTEPAGSRRRLRPPRPNPTPKAGRDLPAAIGVGLALLAAVLGTLFFLPLGFVAVVAGFACFGVWEISRALESYGIRVAFTPLILASAALPFVSYLGGLEALLYGAVIGAFAILVWRSAEHADGAAPSIYASTFILAWVPFLISFAVLSIHTGVGQATLGLWPGGEIPQGVFQLMTMLLLVVANDTFGYLVGASLGKHPMAPKISPKKSWEGFAGSVGGAVLIGVLACVLFLDKPWWFGVVLAVGMVGAATAGDLAESMVKRELGVKDMSSILPGHGGVMDRLDSILFGSPVAFILFHVFESAH